MQKNEPIRDEETLRNSALFKDRYVGKECPKCHQGRMIVTAVGPSQMPVVERTCNHCGYQTHRH